MAVAQFGSGTDKAENLAALRSAVAQAANAGARVVVAPEYAMFAASKLDQRMIDAAEPLTGEWVSTVREIASEHGLFVCVGVAEELSGDDRISNALVACSPDGEIAAVYRKLHMYDAFGFAESAVVRPGDITEPETFTVDDLTFGLQTCYDLRFPEVTRRIVDAGAHVVLLPAQWVPGPQKEDHWTTLIRARAIENTVYIAAADQPAPFGAGNSMIVDPMGLLLASLGERTATTTALLSAARIEEVRRKNPCLELRRFRW